MSEEDRIIENSLPSVVIKSIKFNNGKEISFNSDDIVLLVGANNVGKSRTLKDLNEDILQSDGTKILVNEVVYQTEYFTKEKITEYFERNVSKSNNDSYYIFISNNHQWTFSKNGFDSLKNDSKNFYKVFFSFLTTESRLQMSKPIKLDYIEDKRSLNIFKKLEEDSKCINELNNILTDAFKKSIDVYEDYNDDGVSKEYKIGESEVINNAINSNKRDCINILKDLDGLHYQGDGIRSAVAILSCLIVYEHSLFFIDEPETFLHPPQAKLIGKNISQLSKNKQCFIATHNIDFIKGVLEADSSRVKIIKIDRDGETNTYNVIDNDSIVAISNDKNLKYTNILDGLFYNRLVLCENESDCKFYASILETLNSEIYQNTLFCAVGGKDQFKKIVPLLKQLSIRFSVIADIDLINNKANLKELLNAVSMDSYDAISSKHNDFLVKFNQEMDTQVKTQETIKREINNVFDDDKFISDRAADRIKSILKNISSFKLLKNGGRNIIPQGECVSLFDEINNYLKNNNIFILECGEIERFVPDISGHGNVWLEKVFQVYSDFNDGAYNNAKKFIKTVFNI